MDKELAFKWADALESGDYKQGQGALETIGGRNCCLGVLCYVTGLPKTEWEFNAVPLSLQLPQLGLKTRNGTLPFHTRTNISASLTDLNDSGLTFSQIADVIRCFYDYL